MLYELRNGRNTVGLNMAEGKVDCVESLGIYESFKVKE
jgi:hypothetical protein